MADLIEWVGMIAFAVVFGSFLGFVVTEGSYVSGAAGAVILAVLAAVYLLTIAENGRKQRPPTGH